MVLQAISGILTVESGQWYTVNQTFDTENNGLEEFCEIAESARTMCPGRTRMPVRARLIQLM